MMTNSNLVYFNSRDELLRIDLSNVVYIEADGNITEVVCANKLKAPVSMNLAAMEQFLSKQTGELARSFVRIGKRYIVNLTTIYRINLRLQKLTLSDNDRFVYQLDISKEALKKLRELMLELRK
ncbi:MAG: LytTR family transcriptional regulator [Bacteroidaceae bacterium]|nr:LytTR family transcriptional regulator [Bacteroidaceae bacterium]